MITNYPKNKSTVHKIVIASIAAAICLILILSTFEIAGITHLFRTSNIKTTDQKKESEVNSKNKQDLVDKSKNSSNTGSTNTLKPTSNDISLTSQIENDGSLTIFTRLKNYSDGTCNLTISNNDTKYTQTAPILFQTAFSTCAGFNIKSDVLAPGAWQVVLTVTSKGIINTKTINVEMK